MMSSRSARNVRRSSAGQRTFWLLVSGLFLLFFIGDGDSLVRRRTTRNNAKHGSTEQSLGRRRNTSAPATSSKQLFEKLGIRVFCRWACTWC